MIYREKRGKATEYPGLSTNSKTRPLMIDALYSYITQFPEIVKSNRLALELTGLVSKTNGRVEADRGCRDDLALSTAVCFYVRKYDPPMLISSMQHQAMERDLTQIVDFNTGGRRDFSNEAIIEKVKENLDEFAGFTDILQLYRE
jgi:hypothetical protein